MNAVTFALNYISSSLGERNRRAERATKRSVRVLIETDFHAGSVNNMSEYSCWRLRKLERHTKEESKLSMLIKFIKSYYPLKVGPS